MRKEITRFAVFLFVIKVDTAGGFMLLDIMNACFKKQPHLLFTNAAVSYIGFLFSVILRLRGKHFRVNAVVQRGQLIVRAALFYPAI